MQQTANSLPCQVPQRGPSPKKINRLKLEFNQLLELLRKNRLKRQVINCECLLGEINRFLRKNKRFLTPPEKIKRLQKECENLLKPGNSCPSLEEIDSFLYAASGN